MKSPFTFGKIATGSAFVNRVEEINALSENFRNGVNSILTSPRRWGKSSLVKRTAKFVEEIDPKTRFCFLDLFRIRSEEEFYQKFAAEVIRSSAGKFDEWVRDVKHFLGPLSPGISFGADPGHEFKLRLNIESRGQHAKGILELPEKVATKKKLNLVVCINDFQNIGSYREPMEFQKLLRSIWQHHQHASYCLCGSKRHRMMELFENASGPFYKFGDLFLLEKIKKEPFVEFIVRSFSRTEKSIDREYAGTIVDRVEAHPYFVQQLAHIVWTNTTETVTEEILDQSTLQLTEQNGILFHELVRGLSGKQLNFLIALAKGETQLNATEVMQRYKLGTSGNVTKVKRVLMEKEILDTENGNQVFQDPVFRRWILRMFGKSN